MMMPLPSPTILDLLVMACSLVLCPLAFFSLMAVVWVLMKALFPSSGPSMTGRSTPAGSAPGRSVSSDVESEPDIGIALATHDLARQREERQADKEQADREYNEYWDRYR